MKTLAELFHQVTMRNALRREAKLPLLDVRNEVARDDHTQRMAHHHAGYDLFKEEIKKIRAGILVVEREKHGPKFGTCAGSRRALGMIATPYIRGFLATVGHPFPGLRDPIVYGQDKDHSKDAEPTHAAP